MRWKAAKAALPYTMPVFMGYIFLGIAFGILLTSKGYHFGWAVLMSFIIYAGSMQFVAISILTGPFNLIRTAFLTLSVNARHLFYGLSMLDKFKNLGGKRRYMIFSLTDETYSLLCGTKPPEGVDESWFYLFIALFNQCYWVLGSLIGSVAGSLIHFDSTGIDFAMTALFVVIFVEQWESQKEHGPALIGVAVSLICLLLFGSEAFIIPSMIGILAALTLLRGRLESREERGGAGK